MTSGEFTGSELEFISNADRFLDKGELVIRYKPVRSIGTDYTVTRGIVVIPYGLNGEMDASKCIDLGFYISPLRGVSEKILGEEITQDFLNSFPHLWDRFHLVVGDELTKAHSPSHITMVGKEFAIRDSKTRTLRIDL